MNRVRADITQTPLPDESLQGRPFDLPDDVAHYLRDVRRLDVGAAVELFDGTGRVLRGKLQQVTDHGVAVFVEEDTTDTSRESPCEVTLLPVMPKRKRWRWVIEKATELGVRRIEPLTSDHAVVDIPDDRVASKLERWQKILGSAARQSERAVTPTISAPMSLEDRLEAYSPEGLAVAPAARSDGPSLDSVLSESDASGSDAPGAVDLWVGPEGGFSDGELQAMESRDITLCRLGPRILRAETAAVAAITTIQTRLGDLGV